VLELREQDQRTQQGKGADRSRNRPAQQRRDSEIKAAPHQQKRKFFNGPDFRLAHYDDGGAMQSKKQPEAATLADSSGAETAEPSRTSGRRQVDSFSKGSQ
jgi:hypothetical protein